MHITFMIIDHQIAIGSYMHVWVKVILKLYPTMSADNPILMYIRYNNSAIVIGAYPSF